jgi:alanyl-tRNA synthetase
MKGKIRFVQAIYPDRAVEELRFLGDELSRMPGIVAVLATVGNGRYSLVVACSADTGQNAAALLSAALSKMGGHGGGSAQLAQGGGPSTVEHAETIIRMVRQAI